VAIVGIVGNRCADSDDENESFSMLDFTHKCIGKWDFWKKFEQRWNKVKKGNSLPER
jgi:hypothetical protein